MCLLAFSNHYRYHHVCDLAESGGFLGGSGNLGNGLSRGTNGRSVRTVATAMPNQTCVAVRLPRPLPCTNRGKSPTERDLAHAEGRSSILCQAFFRVDMQVVSI